MYGMIKSLMVCAVLLVGCREIGVTQTNERQSEIAKEKTKIRPLSPARMISFHFDRRGGQTYLQTRGGLFSSDISPFVNVAFSDRDTVTGHVLNNSKWYPKFHFTSFIRPLKSYDSLWENLEGFRLDVIDPTKADVSETRVYFF